MNENKEKRRPCFQREAGIKCEGPRNCARCGFNPTEEDFRKAYVKKFGLSRTGTGAQQLVVSLKNRVELDLELSKA